MPTLFVCDSCEKPEQARFTGYTHLCPVDWWKNELISIKRKPGAPFHFRVENDLFACSDTCKKTLEANIPARAHRWTKIWANRSVNREMRAHKARIVKSKTTTSGAAPALTGRSAQKKG